MVIIIKYWCCVCILFIGRLELIEVGSELEFNEVDFDVCFDFWLLWDDEDVEFDEVLVFLIIGWESEFLIFFIFRLFFDFWIFLLLVLMDFRVLEFDFLMVCCKFCKGDGVFRFSFLEEEECIEVFVFGLCFLFGVKISFWLWLEFMFLKFLIKLFVNNFRDVE